MRKYLIGLLMLISCSAWADWVQVADSSVSTYFVDRASIRKEGSFRKVWEIENYKKQEKGVQSTRSRVEYDCKQERYKTLTISTHTELMAEGLALENESNANNPWRDIPPKTVSARLLQYACSN
jgi:hypothetical protein